MDKMVAPSPLVFNFRVCVWLGIGNQEALSVSSPNPPASGLGLTLGGRPSCFTEPRSSVVSREVLAQQIALARRGPHCGVSLGVQ